MSAVTQVATKSGFVLGTMTLKGQNLCSIGVLGTWLNWCNACTQARGPEQEDPSTHGKNLRVGQYICNPRSGEAETGPSLESYHLLT